LELEKLYALYPRVRIHFEAILLPTGRDEQFFKAISVIDKEFNARIPHNPDLRKIKKTISDFAKLHPDLYQLGRLKAQYALSLMKFMEQYGAQEPYCMPFYNTAKAFFLFVGKNELQSAFLDDAKEIAQYERDWGSDLWNVFESVFKDVS